MVLFMMVSRSSAVLMLERPVHMCVGTYVVWDRRRIVGRCCQLSNDENGLVVQSIAHRTAVAVMMGSSPGVSGGGVTPVDGIY